MKHNPEICRDIGITGFGALRCAEELDARTSSLVCVRSNVSQDVKPPC